MLFLAFMTFKVIGQNDDEMVTVVEMLPLSSKGI